MKFSRQSNIFAIFVFFLLGASLPSAANAATVVEQTFFTNTVLWETNAGFSPEPFNSTRWAQTFSLSASTTVRSVSFAAELWDKTQSVPFANQLFFCKRAAGFDYSVTDVVFPCESPSGFFGTTGFVQYATSTDGIPMFYIQSATGMELGPGDWMFFQGNFSVGAVVPGGEIRKMYINRAPSSLSQGRATMYAQVNPTPSDFGYSDAVSPWLGYDGQDMVFKITDSTSDSYLGVGTGWLDEQVSTIGPAINPPGTYHATTTTNVHIKFEYYIPSSQAGPLSLCIYKEGGIGQVMVPICYPVTQGSIQTFEDDFFFAINAQYYWYARILKQPAGPLDFSSAEVVTQGPTQLLFVGVPSEQPGQNTLENVWNQALQDAIDRGDIEATSTAAASTFGSIVANFSVPPFSYIKQVFDQYQAQTQAAAASSTTLQANPSWLGATLSMDFGGSTRVRSWVGSAAIMLIQSIIGAAVWIAVIWHLIWLAWYSVASLGRND